MRRPGLATVLLGSALTLTLVACSRDIVPVGTPPCDDPAWGDPAECDPGPDEPERPPLSRERMEAYYAAQITWRDCAIGEGLDLPEPPSLEEFAAEEGAWWVGADVSEEDWNTHIVEDESGNGRVGRACGEPPHTSQFLVSREALERAYAWNLEVLACLDDEGFPVETTPPPLEDFVEAVGKNWSPYRDFTRRYGRFPSGADWDRVVVRCGGSNSDLWLEAWDFE